MVEAVAIVIETGFRVEIFCRETMAEEVGERAGLRNDFSESVASVLRYGVTVCVEVARDITDVVVAGNI